MFENRNFQKTRQYPEKMELFNLGPAVMQHKKYAYQEGRETDCKIMCVDGHIMVIYFFQTTNICPNIENFFKKLRLR